MSIDGITLPRSLQISLNKKRYAISGDTMGTRYSAIFWANQNADGEAIANALQGAVDQIDNQMSPWKPHSDLVRFNQAAIDEWFEIPFEMSVVINEALHISKLSHGAFHIGLGELVNQWGFGPTQSRSGVDVIAAQPIQPCHEIFQLDTERLRLKKNAPVRLDLCGIAKGFGVDELSRTLLGLGVEDFLVSIDGEIKASGMNGDVPWQVGIEQPDIQMRSVALEFEIGDIAMATSGNYRHFRSVGDNVVSHTMDGQSGTPVQNTITSVTVASEHCLSADAWATAFMVMGSTEALQLANRLDIDVLLFSNTNDQQMISVAGGFSDLVR